MGYFSTDNFYNWIHPVAFEAWTVWFREAVRDSEVGTCPFSWMSSYTASSISQLVPFHVQLHGHHPALSAESKIVGKEPASGTLFLVGTTSIYYFKIVILQGMMWIYWGKLMLMFMNATQALRVHY